MAYRASACDQAARHGLVGWVRNLPSGEVQGLAQGEASDVDAFLAWARRGPIGAHVSELEIHDEQLCDELTRFEIRR